MAFDVITSSYETRERPTSVLRRVVGTGVIFGLVCVYLAVVGILFMFHGRWIIAEVLTLAHAALILVGLVVGVQISHKATGSGGPSVLLHAAAAGAIAGACLALLVAAMSVVNLRFMFIALSPQLLELLTFGLGAAAGAGLLVVGGAALGLLGALLHVMPPAVRRPVVMGLSVTAFVGLFQELIQLMMQYDGPISWFRAMLFTWDGLTLGGAVAVFVAVSAGSALWTANRGRAKASYARLPPVARTSARLSATAAGILLLLLFPLAAGSFIGQVLMLVGLYILMGMGLNLEVGLAGLLDLGFVAFFAVGAYTTALLTADSPHALASLSYWQALPIAIAMTTVVGVLFGVPVLGIRGDYLAVATLGLGEIIRVVVLSDMAAPLLGGAQGVLNIPRPTIGDLELNNPVRLFYLTLAAAAIAAYFAWRLQNSRLGRAWTAVRDDEDVAQALGINLINIKLLAYGIGAAFAGVAGSIFAVMLTSIYPHSFQLLISINVLALIIVGGMGSLPGVVVGSLALIGLPELLREFGEYRFLFYGLALVVMMRLKPEGLWPSKARQREVAHIAELESEIEAKIAPTARPAPADGPAAAAGSAGDRGA